MRFIKGNVKLLVLLALVTYTSILAECPEGWYHHGESCYLINKHVRLSWAEANSDCSAMVSGKLAIVESPDLVNFLFTKINPTHQRPPNGVCQTEDDYWIDGTDQVVEGHWVWGSTLQPIKGNFWCPGNPSNSGGEEDCLEFKDGLWNDDDCHKQQPFICEIEYPGEGQTIIG